jgi:tetratricopeptide (TPR) repeat protein
MKTAGVARLAAACALASLAAVPPARSADRIPITTSSEEARLLYLKGRDLLERLRAPDARALFEQAAAKDPDFALAQVGLANSAGTAKGFLEGVDRAVALSGKASEPEKLVICALDAGAKGEPERQRDCLARLVAASSDDERAHNLMGAFHFGRQDYEAAIAEYEKASAINPAFSQPYNQKGYAYRFLGRYADAEQAFKRYIELIPDDPNPYDSYAELLMKMGRFEESIRSYEKALSVDPRFVASYVGIGNVRVLMGKGEDARRTFGKIAGIARNDGERRQAHFWTAMSFVHEGATDRALAELRNMAAIDEAGKDLVALAGATAQMGNILLEAGRVDEAAQKYGERTAIIDRAEVAAQVKEAARRQALFDEARVALARNDLATAKAKAASYSAAAAAKAIPFETRQSHELRGRVALARKDYATAAAELRQANQQDPRVLYLTAVALQGKGEAGAAKELAARAADWNALSNTYAFVRRQARTLASGTSFAAAVD